jgi:hypothetical protein
MDTKFNNDLQDFALVVNRAAKDNSSFRKLIQEQALLKLDGDYDVLLKQIADKEVSEGGAKSAVKSGRLTILTFGENL